MTRIDHKTHHIIPAQPGFYLITWYEGNDSINKDDIIGWSINIIDDDPYPTAITAADPDNCEYKAVLTPSGNVLAEGCHSFRSIDEFRDWCRSIHANPCCMNGVLGEPVDSFPS